MHIFVLYEETGVPDGNLHKHMENDPTYVTGGKILIYEAIVLPTESTVHPQLPNINCKSIYSASFATMIV